MPENGIYAVDTALLYNALVGVSNGEKYALSKMCSLLGVNDSLHFHNAGNDAHVRFDRWGGSAY